MSWKSQLRADPMPWLLDKDAPGVRYVALRDLMDLSPDDAELRAARREAHCDGPISAILDEMDPAGFWAQPGHGYNPKYRSTVWSLIALAQLGASIAEDERIERACNYYLDHAFNPAGQLSSNGAPGGTVDCLQGNMCWALIELGCEDPRLEVAHDWMARSNTGEGVAPMEEKKAPLRYYAGKCGPDFACGANERQGCAWGAAKVMMALGRWPAERRTPLQQRAIDRGVAFLLGIDPMTGEYPHAYAAKPSGNWWKFGFPVFYVTDLLQVVEALSLLGYGNDPRLAGTLDFIREKQDAEGRWPLEYDYAGKTWVELGQKKKPNPWVTLRALRVLKAGG